jgi:hypothetical protein
MPGRSKVAGAMLVLAGISLYLADLANSGVHWLVVPAAAFVGIGALFTMFGAVDHD